MCNYCLESNLALGHLKGFLTISEATKRLLCAAREHTSMTNFSSGWRIVLGHSFKSCSLFQDVKTLVKVAQKYWNNS